VYAKRKIATILQIEKIHDVQNEKKKTTKSYQKASTHKGKMVKHCYK
jgi:hypothetical protein